MTEKLFVKCIRTSPYHPSLIHGFIYEVARITTIGNDECYILKGDPWYTQGYLKDRFEILDPILVGGNRRSAQIKHIGPDRFVVGRSYIANRGDGIKWHCQWANGEIALLTHSQGAVGTVVRQETFPCLGRGGPVLKVCDLEYDPNQQGDREDDI